MEANGAVKCVRKSCCSFPPLKPEEKKKLQETEKSKTAKEQADKAKMGTEKKEKAEQEKAKEEKKQEPEKPKTKPAAGKENQKPEMPKKKGDACPNGGIFSGAYCSFALSHKFSAKGNGHCQGLTGVECIAGDICCTLPAKKAPQPVKEAPKPAKKSPETVKEAPKPAKEAPKPAKEAPKPAKKVPTPATPKTKPVAEVPKTKPAAGKENQKPEMPKKKGDTCPNGGVFSGVHCSFTYRHKFSAKGNGQCQGLTGVECIEGDLCCTVPQSPKPSTPKPAEKDAHPKTNPAIAKVVDAVKKAPQPPTTAKPPAKQLPLTDSVFAAAKAWGEGRKACDKIGKMYAEKVCPKDPKACGQDNICHEGKCCRQKDDLSKHCGPKGHYLGEDCDTAKNCGISLIVQKGAVCTNSLCCTYSDPASIRRRIDEKLLHMGETLCARQKKTFTGQFCHSTPTGKSATAKQRKENAKMCEGMPKLERICINEGFCCEEVPRGYRRPYV